MRPADPSDDPFANLIGAEVARPSGGPNHDVMQHASAAVERSRVLRERVRALGEIFPTPEERGVNVVEVALRQFGAQAAVSVRLGAKGVPELVGATGAWSDLVGEPTSPDADSHQAAPVPLTREGPLVEALRTGVPSFCGSHGDLAERWPRLANALAQQGIRAVAAVPVRYMSELEGGLALLFEAPRRFPRAERALLRTMAVRYARSLAHARLYYSEHAARTAEADARCEAERAREVAERASRVKDDFLAVVSHELRTPLQAVIGFSELLDAELAGPLTARQREFVQRIQAGGSHLLHVIEDLLGFSRAQAGKEVVHTEAFDPADVVRQVVAMAQPLADRKGLRLWVTAPDGGVRFASDPFKLRQIATNLVANAVKFTGWGEVVVTLEAWDAAGDAASHGAAAARVCLAVRDTGVGIPPDQQEAVFEPFVQAAAPTTRSQGGTGLGLSIVRQLARLLGGDVRLARSAVGSGSTFEVELPSLASRVVVRDAEAERGARDQPEPVSRDSVNT